MALEIVKHVDGKKVFPKLEAYIRTYREKYQYNRRVEDAVKEIDSELKRLQEFNTDTLPVNERETVGEAASDRLPVEETEAVPARSDPADSDTLMVDDPTDSDTLMVEGEVAVGGAASDPSKSNDSGSIDGACSKEQNASIVNPATTWTAPVFFPQLQRVPPKLTTAQGNYVPVASRQGQIVGGTQIGIFPALGQATAAKEWGRGKDKKQRKKRRCKRCIDFQGTQAEACKGAHGGRTGGSINCQYFSENGEPKAGI